MIYLWGIVLGKIMVLGEYVKFVKIVIDGSEVLVVIFVDDVDMIIIFQCGGVYLMG